MSFLEEIANLTTAAPSVDPELVGWADESAFLSAKATSRPYHILDDTEIGEPISRNELFDDGNVSGVDDEAADLLSRGLEDRLTGDVASEDGASGDEMSDEGVSGDDGEGYNTGDSGQEAEDAGSAAEEESDLKMVQQRNLDDEEEKRQAVKLQVGCWDKFVQLRLKLQPCLQEVSRLPPLEKRHKYMSGDVSQAHRQQTLTNIQHSLDKLLDLQDTLVQMNPGVKSVMTGSKKTVDDDEIPSDTDEEDEQDDPIQLPKRKRKQNSEYYLNLNKSNAEKFDKYKTETIVHWYEQTKVVAKKSSFMNKEVSVLDQINNILANKDRLITRTIQNRSSTQVFGEEDVETHPCLFNDDDFYQQLLREIIDKKMGNIDKSDPDAMGRQWVELEKLKVKSKKKVVDTKASKGRKVRYDVHSKLLGFMAPVSLDTMADNRQDELFSSLFSSNL